MNSKMTAKSQLSTNEPNKKKRKERKTTKPKTKQTPITGIESEKWTSHGGFSVGRGKGGIGGQVYREKEV